MIPNTEQLVKQRIMNQLVTSLIYENIVHMFLDFMGWADFFGTPTLTGVWWYMCFAQILIWVIFISFMANSLYHTT